MTDDEPEPYACDGCARSGVPLLEIAEGRSLCLECVEAAPDQAGVERRQGVEMLRTMTRIVRKLD